MGRFDGKKVLVTGAGRGFGRTLALAFAQEGADVVVHYNSSASGAEDVAREVRALGRKSATVKGDISSYADVQNIAKTSFDAPLRRLRTRPCSRETFLSVSRIVFPSLRPIVISSRMRGTTVVFPSSSSMMSLYMPLV